jgi:hypothetical protein
VSDVAGLQRLVANFEAAPDRIQQEMARAAAAEMIPLWVPGLSARVSSPMQAAILLPGSRAYVDNDRVWLRAADSPAPLSGGLVPADRWQGAEFGANPKYKDVSRLGRRRRQLVNVQFYPRKPDGKVVYPLFREILSKAAGVFARAVIRGFANGSPDYDVTKG